MRGGHHLGGLAGPGASLKGAGSAVRSSGLELVGSAGTASSTGAPGTFSLPSGSQPGDLIVGVAVGGFTGLSRQPVVPVNTSAVNLTFFETFEADFILYTSVVEGGQTSFQTVYDEDGSTYNHAAAVLRGPLRADFLTAVAQSGLSLTPADVPDGGLKDQLIVVETRGTSTFPPEYIPIQSVGLGSRLVTLLYRPADGAPGLQTQTGNITSSSTTFNKEMKAWLR